MPASPFRVPASPGSHSSRIHIWSIRLLLALTLLSLILAQTVFRSTSAHDFCIGFGIGTLGAALMGSFLLNRIGFRSSGCASDVDNISVTH